MTDPKHFFRGFTACVEAMDVRSWDYLYPAGKQACECHMVSYTFASLAYLHNSRPSLLRLKVYDGIKENNAKEASVIQCNKTGLQNQKKNMK